MNLTRLKQVAVLFLLTFILVFSANLLNVTYGTEDPLSSGSVSISNNILKAIIEDDYSIGIFTIKTDAGHPNPDQNVFYGGETENPWSSFTTIRVEDTLREYVTSTGKEPSSGYTVECLDDYSPAVTRVSDTRATISWTTAENLLVTLLIDIRGTSLADTMLQVTVTIQNEDTITHSVAVRHEWDLKIDGEDDSWIRVWTNPNTPQSWTETETEWVSPSFQFWETTNNPDSPVFSIYGSTVLPHVYPSPTVPDRFVYASWAACYGNAYSYTPSGRSGMDSAVLYYWNAVEISPGARISRTAYVTTVVQAELEALAWSCDSAGNSKSTFEMSDNFYARGESFPADTSVTIYLIPDGEDVLPANVVATASATTDTTGDLPVTLVWSQPLSMGEYDIWVDANQNEEFDAGDVWNTQVGGIYAFSVSPPVNTPPYQPQLSITPSLTVEDNDDLAVTVTGPTPADPEGDIVTYTYRWLVDLGTGEFLDDEDAGRGEHTGNTVTAEDTVLGDIWRVEVTPVDEYEATGLSAIATWQPVVLDEIEPVADAGGPYMGTEDEPISFNGEASYDSDGSIVSYHWDFGDGYSSTGQNPTHAYSQDGTYTITLTVTDNDGATDTHTTTITVEAANQPPHASFTLSPTSPEVDETVNLDASSSSDPDGTIVDYAWNFGDGTTGTGMTASHSYSSAGTYTITLTVTNNDGLTDTATKGITVIPPVEPVEPDVTSPEADAGNNQTVKAGSVITFDASASSDNVGIVSYEWDFGDGTTGTNITATHTYTEPGNYLVTLTVEDAAGNRVTDSCMITVEPPEIAGEEVVREPRSLSVVAQVAVVGTAAVAASALAAGSGTVGQAINSAVSGLPIPDWLKDFLQLYGKDVFETVDKTELAAMEEVPLISKGELASISISALTMTIAFCFIEANGLPDFLNPSVIAVVIPYVLLAVVMENIVEVFAEALCARICRVYRQVKLWLYGFALFLISSLLFRFPMGSPIITRYQSGQISNKKKGLLILSKLLILLILTFPFAGLYMLGFNILGDAGLLITLMTVFYCFIPLKPIVGKSVFDYKKGVSLLALVSTGILFFSFAFNILPYIVYLAVGVVSMVLVVITLYLLSKSTSEITKPTSNA